MKLLSIGAFARATRLSPKALRLYDESRLLEPVHVDPDTGYRWYSVPQIAVAQQVAQLRRLDMPLARIRTVIGLTPEAMAAEVAAFWDEQRLAGRPRRSWSPTSSTT